MSPQTDRRLEVFLDTNNKCNLKCLTCAFSDPRVSQLKTNTMSLELFDRICDEVLTLAEYATLSCLTEPLMTREFSQFLARAGRCEIPRLEFVTNALLLREEHLAACIQARLWRLTISVDGSDPETYESIRRGGRFDRLRKNIAMVVDHFSRHQHQPGLRIIMTLIRENFMTAASSVQSFIDWGATEIELRETVTFPMIGLEDRQLRDRRVELDRELEQARAIAGEAKVPIEISSEKAPDESMNLTDIPPCHALERRVAIAANGDVMPCMLWAREPLGNLHQQSFEEIWHGARRIAFREEFREKTPLMWCPTCTACKDDPLDEDAYYRLLAKTDPGE